MWKDWGKINASGKKKFWEYKENMSMLQEERSCGPNAYQRVQIQK